MKSQINTAYSFFDTLRAAYMQVSGLNSKRTFSLQLTHFETNNGEQVRKSCSGPQQKACSEWEPELAALIGCLITLVKNFVRLSLLLFNNSNHFNFVDCWFQS